MLKHIDITNLDNMQRFAERVAKATKKGDIVLLKGDLGSGKTTFARFFIHALSHTKEDVPSPTFTLLQTFETEHFDIWHFDLYRLERVEDVYMLGIEDAFGEAVCLIEWPEIIEENLPGNVFSITFEFAGEGARKVAVSDDNWLK